MLKIFDTTNSRLLTDAKDEWREATLCEALTLCFCSSRTRTRARRMVTHRSEFWKYREPIWVTHISWMTWPILLWLTDQNYHWSHAHWAMSLVSTNARHATQVFCTLFDAREATKTSSQRTQRAQESIRNRRKERSWRKQRNAMMEPVSILALRALRWMETGL